MDVSLSELWELVMDKGGLACSDSWDRKESETTEWLKYLIIKLANNKNLPLKCILWAIYVNMPFTSQHSNWEMKSGGKEA